MTKDWGLSTVVIIFVAKLPTHAQMVHVYLIVHVLGIP